MCWSGTLHNRSASKSARSVDSRTDRRVLAAPFDPRPIVQREASRATRGQDPRRWSGSPFTVGSTTRQSVGSLLVPVVEEADDLGDAESSLVGASLGCNYPPVGVPVGLGERVPESSSSAARRSSGRSSRWGPSGSSPTVTMWPGRMGQTPGRAEKDPEAVDEQLDDGAHPHGVDRSVDVVTALWPRRRRGRTGLGRGLGHVGRRSLGR